MKARVTVSLKDGILDPQGKAVEQSLKSLGFKSVKGVRVGKFIEMEVDAGDAASAGRSVEEMCKKLLSNPVTENYQVRIVDNKKPKK